MSWSSKFTTRMLIAGLIVLLLLLQYHLWFGNGSIPQVVKLKNQLHTQLEQNKKLQQRNQLLIAEVKDLQAGHQAIEERARNELGMVKKGETFYQVVK